MSEYTAKIDAHLQQIAESVRVLAQAAIAERDDSRMLGMIEAVGSMAVGAQRYAESMQLGMIADTSAASTAPEPEAIQPPDRQPDTPRPEVVPQLKPVPDLEPEATPEIPAAAVEAETPGQETEPGLLPGLTLTTREQSMLNFMRANPGVELKKGEIIEAPGMTGTPDSRGQAFTLFMRKLDESPYKDRVSKPGARQSRRFIWTEPETASDTSQAPGNTNEASDPMPEQQTEATPVEAAAAFGLTLSQNGHNEFSYRGIPLRLTTFAADVVMEVVQKAGQSTFRDLVQSEALLATYDQKHIAHSLNEALSEIERVLKPHDNLEWTHAKTPDSATGKLIRPVRLRNTAPTEDTDFLATRAL